jgi:hypothetical protein
MLESHDEVISVPDSDYIAAGHFVSPCLYPQVEYVVQVDVCQQGRNDSPDAKDNFEFERRLGFRRKSSAD